MKNETKKSSAHTSRLLRIVLDIPALAKAGYEVVDVGALSDGSPYIVTEVGVGGPVLDRECVTWAQEQGLTDYEIDAFVEETASRLMQTVLSKIALRVR